METIRQKPMPQHIAIIMDGNGRWAKVRKMPRIFGHRAGTRSVREIVKACGELGIKVLTLYAFSTENWTRPRLEVAALMRLLCSMLRTEILELNKNDVRLAASGRIGELPASVQRDLNNAIEKLKSNQGLTLNLALNYGGRQEIIDAVNALIRDGAQKVTPELFRNYLYTKNFMDPDLLIRTSGEMRISNFLLYQMAYTEFFVTKVLWPDFGRYHLYQAIADYQSRDRRYGGHA